MDLMHRCSFCGWERGKGSETLLEPLCERCGCVLEAGGAAAGASAAAIEPRALVAARRVAVIVLLLAIVPVVLVAAKVGYGHGGLPLAAGATAVAALLLYVFLAPEPH
jgi:hypothetical protein